MRWYKNEIDICKKMYSNGESIIEISDTLKRTTKSIHVKMYRLGVSRPQKDYYTNYSCGNCKETFSALISEKRKYCSESCASTINNKKRKKKGKKCKNCKNYFENQNEIYCSKKCELSNKENFYFNKIENGDLDDINYNTGERWVKRYLIYKYGEKCMKCGWNEVHKITKKVPIQLNHINGNSDNNNLNNVELLCPNCHSLTPNFGSLNLGNGRSKRKIERNGRNNKNVSVVE